MESIALATHDLHLFAHFCWVAAKGISMDSLDLHPFELGLGMATIAWAVMRSRERAAADKKSSSHEATVSATPPIDTSAVTDAASWAATHGVIMRLPTGKGFMHAPLAMLPRKVSCQTTELEAPVAMDVVRQRHAKRLAGIHLSTKDACSAPHPLDRWRMLLRAGSGTASLLSLLASLRMRRI